MSVLVIGGGLIGVTTAYLLKRYGHEVTVVERQEGPGRETSFANGGLLTASMAEPWNAPGSWRVLLSSIGHSDAALQLRLRALPGLAGWGALFLRNSRACVFDRNALTNMRFALYSLGVMEGLRQEAGIEYGRSARGALRIFRDEDTLERAVATATQRLAEGLRFRKLSAAEAVVLEPALEPIADQIKGAVHYEVDETGDAYRFCVALADLARQQGVQFQWARQVTALEARTDRITGVLCGSQRLIADQYVVAAGSYSAPLLQHVGVRVPVRPAKGYSITFDGRSVNVSLSIPVIDDQLHAAIVPIDGAIRVAGTAEFAGYDLALAPARIRNLANLLRHLFPQAQLDSDAGRPWCGLRAMSADGVPIIGATRFSNLLVNTGHGHLGWTMAAGSAQLLADLMCGRSTQIDPAPFALARFAS